MRLLSWCIRKWIYSYSFVFMNYENASYTSYSEPASPSSPVSFPFFHIFMLHPLQFYPRWYLISLCSHTLPQLKETEVQETTEGKKRQPSSFSSPQSPFHRIKNPAHSSFNSNFLFAILQILLSSTHKHISIVHCKTITSLLYAGIHDLGLEYEKSYGTQKKKSTEYRKS